MRILAIASKGGHWIQLLRITKAMNKNDLVYVSTYEALSQTVKNHKFYTIPEGNRNAVFGLFRAFFLMLQIIRKVKPDVIITTGSAPALMGVVAGAITGRKTIWVDSIANVEKVSTSGKLAAYVASRVYTQWPDLTNKKFIFNGNVLS